MPASAAPGSTLPGFSDAMEVTGLHAGHHECDGHPVMHRHPEVEVNYIASGAIDYRYGDRSLSLGPGSLVVFWASVPHIASHLEPDTTQLWCHIPVPVFRSWDLPITRRVLGGEVVTFSTDQAYDRTVLDQVLHDTAQSRMQTPHRAAFEKAALVTMRAYLERVCLIDQEFAPSRVDHQPTGRAAEMAGYVVSHADDPSLTIAQVAASVGLHPTTAMREFRQCFGVTIGTYLHQHRVSWAQQLLVTTDDTTSVIGYTVGFASTSSFYATFAKIVGMPPGRFRRLCSGRT